MSLWVFGYGSLLWKPCFPFVSTQSGYILGWKRRFWQGSTDHRGIPGSPGRVVTVLKGSESDQVWGLCYQVAPEKREEILEYLDVREQCGYTRAEVTVIKPDGGFIEALLYTANEENEAYLGPASHEAIARQICSCRGKSGPNTQYLCELADALRARGMHDSHVFELDDLVRGLMTEYELADLEEPASASLPSSAS
eukprot:TRINITY_DN485_c0_g1_i4.p1 TRINITY_DN485_c0_g1~~TRINITY_DN485_c0_g1_i4.p1  ORF type:complete len:196 (+),score=19.78 TRINITY_DN485_c0_g1_i4:190-777(+)